MNDPGRVLVLGAGPTGLGAAYRLEEHGVRDFAVVEATDRVGGLAGSDVDAAGYTWDVGGHVEFSHYTYYDTVLDRALGDAWLEHERESWIWMQQRWIPYPFQYNLHRLSPGDAERALSGLAHAARHASHARPHDFREWILATFGDAVADLFLFPYNVKVWGFPLETLSTEWIGERVAVPDLARIGRNMAARRDDVSWGPNHRFRYPQQGGTGAVWTAVAKLLSGDPIRFERRVTAVELSERRVRFADGNAARYESLISSLPLDTLVGICHGLDARVVRAARDLRHSACHIVGIGLRGHQPPSLAKKCWMYFPEAHSPYYRVTVLSNYSPFNVPEGGDYWSLMAEVCESSAKPVDGAHLAAATLEAMRHDGLIARGADVVSVWHRREAHGYPTPFLGRDEVLACLLPALEHHGVYSRGRFGAWKYEVSNQDHSFMQGVEVVDRLLGVGDEPTLHRPSFVNGGAFLRRPR